MKSNKYTNKHTSDASYWLGVGFTVQKYCFSGWKIDPEWVIMPEAEGQGH